MRLMLYNIRYGAGTGGFFHVPFPFSGYLRKTEENLARITAFIKTIKPDILGLIEVDSGSYRSGRRNQAELIADALGHYHVYKSKYRPAALIRHLPLLGKQGNAFVTSDHIKHQHFHYFRHGVKRLVIELELDHLVIFLVHLSIRFTHRHHQLEDLFGLVRKAKKPVIVAGDFNPLLGARELHQFLAASKLVNANTHGWPSYPSRKPGRQLDFILHSPEIHVREFSIPHVAFSDHMPLVCDFDIRT